MKDSKEGDKDGEHFLAQTVGNKITIEFLSFILRSGSALLSYATSHLPYRQAHESADKISTKSRGYKLMLETKSKLEKLPNKINARVVNAKGETVALEDAKDKTAKTSSIPKDIASSALSGKDHFTLTLEGSPAIKDVLSIYDMADSLPAVDKGI